MIRVIPDVAAAPQDVVVANLKKSAKCEVRSGICVPGILYFLPVIPINEKETFVCLH